MRITKEMLKAKGAKASCCDVRQFVSEWPDGVEVTEENIRRAFALQLDVDWAMRAFLPAQLWEAYKKGVAQLLVSLLAKGE